MNQRDFLTGIFAGVTAAQAGCLGQATFNETYHVAELEAEIEGRGVEVRGLDSSDEEIVTIEYVSEDTYEDLANVAMAFVERIDAGWDAERLDGIARQEPDLAWYAKSDWAREYLEGEITADKYGDKINDTLAPTVVIENDSDNSTNATET